MHACVDDEKSRKGEEGGGGEVETVIEKIMEAGSMRLWQTKVGKGALQDKRERERD